MGCASLGSKFAFDMVLLCFKTDCHIVSVLLEERVVVCSAEASERPSAVRSDQI